MTALTLLDKLWQRHSVEALPGDLFVRTKRSGAATNPGFSAPAPASCKADKNTAKHPGLI